MPCPGERDTRHHRTRTDESCGVAPDYLTNLSRGTPRGSPYDEGHFRAKVGRVLHISECCHLASVYKIAAPPKIVPGRPVGRYEVMDDRKWFIKDRVASERDSVAHVHVVVIIRVEAADLLQSRAPY